MKKLLLVLLAVLVLTLSGCGPENVVDNSGLDEDQVYTREEIDEMLSTNPLVEWKYNHYFDVFQIRVHKDETKVNWISIEIHQVNGVGVIERVRHMENSDTIEEFSDIDWNYPLQTDYYSLTLYINEALQDETYNTVLYALE